MAIVQALGIIKNVPNTKNTLQATNGKKNQTDVQKKRKKNYFI